MPEGDLPDPMKLESKEYLDAYLRRNSRPRSPVDLGEGGVVSSSRGRLSWGCEKENWRKLIQRKREASPKVLARTQPFTRHWKRKKSATASLGILSKWKKGETRVLLGDSGEGGQKRSDNHIASGGESPPIGLKKSACPGVESYKGESAQRRGKH